MDTQATANADVDARARIGSGTCVWQLTQIREGAENRTGCVISRGVYMGTGVQIGDHCKVQNYALVYGPANLHDGFSAESAAVFTNDRMPTAVSSDELIKKANAWHAVGVTDQYGASIGAVTITIGKWAFVAAGAVAVKDVPDFALVVGVPSRFIRGPDGPAPALVPTSARRVHCPETGALYVENNGALQEENS
jgi:UDP-2-acetamido-3-amino-2,3-dideoxy-glucuronate N-acetyltransferase